MRILIVSNLYPPIVFGGYEILCEQVSKHLESRGHNISVLTSDFRASECSDTAKRSLRLTTNFPLPGESVGWVDFRLSTLQRVGSWNARQTLEAIDAFRPDIVFCWCLSRLSLAPVRAAQSRGVPVAYTINDEHPRQFIPARFGKGLKPSFKFLAEKLVWPLTTMQPPEFPVTIISYATRKILLEAGLPIAHSRVIHQGIPIERFAPRAHIDPAMARILYVGQLSRTKGVHTLIGALASLKETQTNIPPWRLEIVGDGVPEYTAELKQLVEQTQIQDRVHFRGRLPHQQLPSVYQDNDIFVFPSEWEEPFGLTHLEAMASGCAVISTTTGGSKELIRDGINALAFEAGNSAQLADCFRRLWSQQGLAQELSLGARAYVEKHHTLTGYTERLEAFLRAAAPGAPPN